MRSPSSPWLRPRRSSPGATVVSLDCWLRSGRRTSGRPVDWLPVSQETRPTPSDTCGGRFFSRTPKQCPIGQRTRARPWPPPSRSPAARVRHSPCWTRPSCWPARGCGRACRCARARCSACSGSTRSRSPSWVGPSLACGRPTTGSGRPVPSTTGRSLTSSWGHRAGRGGTRRGRRSCSPGRTSVPRRRQRSTTSATSRTGRAPFPRRWSRSPRRMPCSSRPRCRRPAWRWTGAWS